MLFVEERPTFVAGSQRLRFMLTLRLRWAHGLNALFISPILPVLTRYGFANRRSPILYCASCRFIFRVPDIGINSIRRMRKPAAHRVWNMLRFSESLNGSRSAACSGPKEGTISIGRRQDRSA